MNKLVEYYRKKLPLRYDKMLWKTLILLEILLALRFALKFIGSDPYTGFNKLLYGITQPLVSPFLKTLGVYKEEGSMFEWTTLAAMVFYGIVIWAIIKIFLTEDAILTSESEKNNK